MRVHDRTEGPPEFAYAPPICYLCSPNGKEKYFQEQNRQRADRGAPRGRVQEAKSASWNTTATSPKRAKYLERFPVLGFDTETRPSFRPGVMFRVSLLQLSAPDVCYLFRLSKIRFDKAIIRLLESKQILKIGAAVSGDLHALHQIKHFREAGFVDLQQLAPDWGIEEKSLRKTPAIVLGQRVSKAQRLEQLGGDDAHRQTAALRRDRRLGLHPHLRAPARHTQIKTQNER